MSKNVVLIDADSLAYIGKSDDTLQQIIEKVDYKIQAILDETQADYYCLFISQGKYFRHALKSSSEESGSYKSNRKYTNQNYNRVIKEYLIAQYNAVSSPLIEADDLCALWMNKSIYLNVAGIDDTHEILQLNTFVPDSEFLIKSEKCNVILAAVDKDLLLSIPSSGRGHLNYNKKLGENEWGMEWIEITQEEAYTNFWVSMIKGDASDGVKGLPGKAEGFIKKEYSDISMLNDSMVYYQYCKHYGISQGIYEFQKNYRLLHLLDCDEDFKREVGYVPELPNFNKVYKENIEIKNEF